MTRLSNDDEISRHADSGLRAPADNFCEFVIKTELTTVKLNDPAGSQMEQIFTQRVY